MRKAIHTNPNFETLKTAIKQKSHFFQSVVGEVGFQERLVSKK